MSADEFDIIKRLFAPLAGAGARGLIDDAAVLGDFVVTTDAIVEGVHFLPGDPIETIAQKALRVNISDLTAKGAKPVGVLLTLIWPKQRDASEIEAFTRGLGEDLRRYDVPLLGGDTTSTDGPLTVSVTAFGKPLGPRTPARADAQAGEQLWVTGAIGDGFLGLRALRDPPALLGAAPADRVDAHAAHVRAAYRTPEPPVRFASALARFASASMDVSDGLIADAGKIAAASNVAIRIDAESIPLSAAGHAYIAGGGALADLITGGDDYQALFTASSELRGQIMQAARETETNVALIGDITTGAGVRVTGAGGIELPIAASGHAHKLGR
jgi:thiamine-monophosphate kinase